MTDDDDAWRAFAPDVPRPPGVIERTVDWATEGVIKLFRIIRHEWCVVSAGSLMLAAVMTWPVLRAPTRALPGGLQEPAQRAWQLAWLGHALIHHPTEVLRGNAFSAETVGYPLSAPLFGYGPLAVLGGSGPEAAVLRYNMAFLLAFALATVGGYALVRQLGAGRAAAAVAAVAVAYAPWRLGQVNHLDALSTGGAMLSLAMLARGHSWSLRRGRQLPSRPGWALAGWATAAWQLSLGPGVGVPFGYALAGLTVVATLAWLARRSPRPPRRLVVADLIGLVVTGGVAAGLTYLHASALPTQPGLDVSRTSLASGSPPFHGLITAPEQSLLWRDLHDPARAALAWPDAMAVLPGYFLGALALAGLVLSLWTIAQRLILLIGVVATAVLAMGTAGPDQGRLGYLQLYWNLPGFDAIRSPSWLIAWTTLLLAILAAGSIGYLARFGHTAIDAMRRRGVRVTCRGLFRLALVLPVLLVLAEGLPSYHVKTVPRTPSALARQARDSAPGSVLVLPTNSALDPTVMLWSTDGFYPVLNGGPEVMANLKEIREAVRTFPDARTIKLLRDHDVRTVVILREPAERAGYTVTTDAVGESTADLNVEVEEDANVIVYALD